MERGNTWRMLLLALSLLTLVFVSPGRSSPYFLMDSETEWLDAVGAGKVAPLVVTEWSDYMFQWNAFLVEGSPYPANTFEPCEIYVHGGGGGGGLDPEDAGLVMVWPPGPSTGSYSSAWKYEYILDPNLSNATITVTVTAPQFGLMGNQINVVSFGIQDVFGSVQAWNWKVGPGSPIPWNVPTKITINTALVGVAATNPVASGFMKNPAFQIIQSQSLIVDENAQWVGGPMPIPPGYAALPGLWNYWHNLVVTPNIPPKIPLNTKWSQPVVVADASASPPLFKGWDERSLYTQRPIAADDWECTNSKPVTDIHWWGSFLNWTQPDPPQLPKAFHIGIWTDVPAGTTFSHPGTLVWQYIANAQNYTWNFAGYDQDPRGLVENEACFQFNVNLPQTSWFYQDPGPNGKNIYWLSIAAIDDQLPTYPWGWKTRPHFYNDGAVRTATVTPVWPPVVGSMWASGTVIKYGQDAWDLAFELSTTNSTFDFGDAPEGALAYPASGVIGIFPTCMTVGPAGWIQHTNFGAWFGPAVDLEADGNAGLCPGFAPYNSDECFSDGDAGLIKPASYTIDATNNVVPCPNGNGASLGTPCQIATWGQNIDINIHNWMPNHDPYVTAYVNVLADWDQNGQWSGASACATNAASEWVLRNFPVPPKYDGPLSALLPPNFLIGPNAGYVWVRFSITEVPVNVTDWDGSGNFEDGETEDYLLRVGQADTDDFGDAPDAPYPTLAASNGAHHKLVSGMFLGAQIDAEGDGQPNASATGDDISNLPDEDGVIFPVPMQQGIVATVQVIASAPGMLDAWIDFNGLNGWSEANEHIFASQPLVAGLNVLTFPVPSSALQGFTFARFRYSTVGGLSYTGAAADGEVEDYYVDIEPGPTADLGDAPDSTNNAGLNMTAYPAVPAKFPTVYGGLLWPYGPLHNRPLGVAYLGSKVSLEWEADIQSDQDIVNNIDPLLNLSNQDGGDDGVIFPISMPSCTPSTFNYNVTALLGVTFPMYVNVWCDWNRDGDWDDTMQCQSGLMAPEWAVQNQAILVPAAGLYTFTTPQFIPWQPATGVGPMWMRITLSEQTWPSPTPNPIVGGCGPAGGYQYGETEDYLFTPEVPAEVDWGDAPEQTYPTLSTSNGANHVITPGFFLGASVDSEMDGQPDAAALGDDNNNLDDEDGVVFTSALLPGQVASVKVTASAAGKLDAWIDFLKDGWDAGDQIATSYALAAGVNTVYFTVPANAKPGVTFSRFRFSSAGGLSFTGPARDGEVEDHEVTIRNIKWLQKPDLKSTGIDVEATGPFILADDFVCTSQGPLSDIHVYGSWYNDLLPLNADNLPDPAEATFVLSLHRDIPAGTGGLSYSRPGPVAWMREYAPGDFQVVRCAAGLEEGWMVPPLNYQPAADTICWRYDFLIPAGEFVQEGSPTNPVIYWLDVQAYPASTEARFGWKTSLTHYYDDAVWGTGMEPYPGPWTELIYPDGHPYVGSSIDLAFAITGPSVGAQYDWGDAPDPKYPTLAMNNGASHLIVAGEYLGNSVDPDQDGQPTLSSDGDDTDWDGDDEDGVQFLTPLVPGQTAQVKVTASVAGVIDAWIDFNNDGSWAEYGDRIFTAQTVAAGVNTLTFSVPVTASHCVSYSRFRFSKAGVASYTGYAPDGEVEDHQVKIDSKWSQPPDTAETGIDVATVYPIITADDFLCTSTGPITKVAIYGSWLHDVVPGDAGQVSFTLSLHDDVPAGPEPYSRPGNVLWTRTFSPGQFTVTRDADGLMEGWLKPPDTYTPLADTVLWRYEFDLNPLEFVQRGTAPNPKVYWLDVQATPVVPTCSFGWKTSSQHWNDDAVWGQGSEPFTGPWYELRYPVGHPYAQRSIDLAFWLDAKPIDCGDAPDPTYPTLLASNGAWHIIVPNFYLGQYIDADPDGQPFPAGNGDDVNGLDDEDGVIFLTPLVPGAKAKVQVTASLAGKLDAWIDYGRDGGWSQTGDQVFASTPLFAGVNVLTFRVPANAVPGRTFSRFRLSSAGGLGYTGGALDGEVEDHEAYVRAPGTVITKGALKKLVTLPLGSLVQIRSDVVTADFTIRGSASPYWYFEEAVVPTTTIAGTSRSAGLGVYRDASVGLAPWAVGANVSCYGTTALIGNEFVLQEIYSWQEDSALSVAPVLQTNKDSGGGPFGWQPGVIDSATTLVQPARPAVGLNGIALLVRLFGQCVYLDQDVGPPLVQRNFWIDDGSNLWDGTTNPFTGKPVLGVKVQVPPGLTTPVQTGKYYAVTGVMRIGVGPAGDNIRWLWPRTAADISQF